MQPANFSSFACDKLADFVGEFRPGDPAAAYCQLVALVDALVGAIVAEAAEKFNEDATVAFDRLLREHRAAWVCGLKA